MRRVWAGIAAGALLCAVVAALGGCGKEQQVRGPTDEQRVRGTLMRFAQASARGDHVTVCRSFLSARLVARLTERGIPCELAMRTGLEDVRELRLLVRRVRVEGDSALAEVRSWAAGQPKATNVVRLVRQGGGWRIAALSDPQPPAPPGPPATPPANAVASR